MTGILGEELKTIWGSVEEAEEAMERTQGHPFDNWPSPPGRVFTTGSRRDGRGGKGRCDLLPARALLRLARHFEGGATKYGDRNWERGQPLSVYADSGLRHLLQALAGRADEDHFIAAAWNLLCLVDTQERIAAGLLPRELDDLPKA